ncbi:MAG TPA: FHA domain-containing protein [Ktedonobacteraceae bacterium]|nr:FHA domain-containing protein [Ktedonobacteraceae bacterium]
MNIVEKPQQASGIKFLTGSLRGKIFSMDKPALTIGSDPSNDIVIRNDPSIAPFHVRLFWQNTILFVAKHPQAGKVRVNRQYIEHGTVPPDTLIELGEDTCCLLTVTEAPTDRRSPQTEYIPKNIPSLSTQRADHTELASLSSLGIPTLEIIDNVSGAKEVFPLNKTTINVGRNSQNDIVINQQSVSSQHLQIIQRGNQLILLHPHPERQQTLNGLLYQGKKIRGDETFRKVLKPGDFFRIASENGSFVTLTF